MCVLGGGDPLGGAALIQLAAKFTEAPAGLHVNGFQIALRQWRSRGDDGPFDVPPLDKVLHVCSPPPPHAVTPHSQRCSEEHGWKATGEKMPQEDIPDIPQ